MNHRLLEITVRIESLAARLESLNAKLAIANLGGYEIDDIIDEITLLNVESNDLIVSDLFALKSETAEPNEHTID